MSKDRVGAAIQNSGYPFPMERITANLIATYLKNEEVGFDVSLAVGILAAIRIHGSYLKMPGVRGVAKLHADAVIFRLVNPPVS